MRTLLLGIGLVIMSCGNNDDNWSGTFYPDRSDLTVHRPFGTFESLEDCRAAATAIMHEGADYECAYHCERHEVFDVNICERVER